MKRFLRKPSVILKRLYAALITILVVIILTFLLFRILPARGFELFVNDVRLGPKDEQNLKLLFGFNRSVVIQMVLYFKNVFLGNFGISYIYKEPVFEIIIARMKYSLLLLAVAQITAILMAAVFSILSVWRVGRTADNFLTKTSLLLISIPPFWLGLVFIIIFLDLLPTSNVCDIGVVQNNGSVFLNIVKHSFLPVLSLTMILYGEYMLFNRSSILETLKEDYILAVRGRGLDLFRIIKNHVLRNTVISMLTVVTINTGILIAAMIQIETVFSWPGIGMLMYEAINQRDYPLIQGIILIIGFGVAVFNMLVQIVKDILEGC
ncbi:Dipeptide transport system permease protein DppB [Koleobacter methoxysyntrophicus]|uniref:Dipeptide transport system permease protein DppB n=1 Tax=Koleobacter methoxysyntrophicus TaxID=2751313 RepID=A0A8A0RMZ0_9FIRM|nr:ABC transporter permease [Koleobacter methoxysyntrophicus]QSQ08817.1 Dipeptide transport system permease protein DppB [Koleobacter methoxysyntrophicus]